MYLRYYKFSFLFLVLFLFLAIILINCTPARMALPDELSHDTEEMLVSGRQGFTWGRNITFGDYRLTNIRRGWVSGRSISIFSYRSVERHRKYSFTLESPYRSDSIDIACITDARLEELDFGSDTWSFTMDIDSDSITVTDFIMDDDSWTVILASNERTGYITEGKITNGRRRILIDASQRLEGAGWDIIDEVGYYFKENNEYLGAVENINRGAVFMKRDLDNFTKDLIAIASGVIFIYEDVLRRN